MNASESKKFIDELSMAFPAVLDAARNSPNIEGTKQLWAAAWDDLTISECREALLELLKGDPLTYEQIRSPGQVIRRLVVSKRNSHLRSEAEIVSQRESIDSKRKRQRDYAAAGSSMLKAFEAMKIGRQIEEVMKLV